VFADAFTEMGGSIVAQEAVDKGQTDMHSVLTTIAAAQPELIYLPIFVAEAGFIVAQSSEVSGLENVTLAGSDGIFTPDFIKAAGPNVEGMYLSSPDLTAFQSGYADFVTKYEALAGQKPISVFHAHAYDATNILLTALDSMISTLGGT